MAGVGSTPIGPALDLHLLPASLLKLSLFPSLHLIQSGAPRHGPSRIGILPAPLADMGLLRQEAGLLQPPLAFSVDVSFAQAGCLRPFPNFFCSLRWWWRHASLRSSERRFLSSRQRSLASSVFFLLGLLPLPPLTIALPTAVRPAALHCEQRGSSHNTPYNPPPATQQQNRKPKSKTKKAIGICKESQSVHQVLCVNVELSANAAELFDEFQIAKLSRWNHGSVCKGSGDALVRCRRGRGRGPH